MSSDQIRLLSPLEGCLESESHPLECPPQTIVLPCIVCRQNEGVPNISAFMDRFAWLSQSIPCLVFRFLATVTPRKSRKFKNKSPDFLQGWQGSDVDISGLSLALRPVLLFTMILLNGLPFKHASRKARWSFCPADFARQHGRMKHSLHPTWPNEANLVDSFGPGSGSSCQ